MLLTLVYACLTYYHTWKRRQRRMKLYRLIQTVAKHCSITASYIKGGHSQSLGSFDSITHYATLALISEGGGKISLSSKKELDLTGWTVYSDISPKPSTCQYNNYLVCQVLSTDPYLSPESQINRLSDYGRPLAWRSGQPFLFLLESSMDKLVSLMLEIIDGDRTLGGNLHLQSINTVSITSKAERILQTPASSPWKLRNHLIGCDQQLLLGSSNESLASTGGEFVGEVLRATSPDDYIEQTMAGEAMAEFSDTTIHSDIHNTITDRTKPPNVLIYCGKKDSCRKFEGVREILSECLDNERYVIYQLKHDQVNSMPWQDNSALLILSSEKLYDGVDTAVLDYFKRGGKVLSFCSSLDDLFIRREQIEESQMNIIQLDCGNYDNVTVIGGRYVYKMDSTCEDYHTDVLGSVEEKPVIIKVREHSDGYSGGKQTGGHVILSQVYLDKDPGEMGISTKIFTMLKQSNETKFHILSYLLAELGMDCSTKSLPKLTSGILLAKDEESIAQLMESLSSRIKSEMIRTPKKTLKFLKEDDCVSVTEDILPVFMKLSDSVEIKYFRPEIFFSHLNTDCLAKVILYADVIPTTMTLFDGLMFSVPTGIDMVAIAGRQTTGKGRGGNAWISPVGCAMFTAHIRITLNSPLGQKPAFIQHIMSVAVVHCIRQLPQYQDVDLRVKWPNDVYFGRSIKLGGVLVTSTVMNGIIHNLIGCGFNVNNSNPTVCINDIIRQHNEENGTRLATFSTEELLARVLTVLEKLVRDFQQDGGKSFCDLYYKYWLHGGEEVQLESEGGIEVKIEGLDQHGYLQVKTSDNRSISLQPNGNTFDMFKHLIAIKSS